MMFGRWENLEENSDGKMQFFLLENQMERDGGKIKEEREEITDQSQEATSPLAVGGTWASRGQRAPLAMGPTARPSGLMACTNFSRAPSVLQPVSGASELRFRIHFWITNRDSLMHDDDYTTLKNGWEIISENDDEVNSTNENEK